MFVCAEKENTNTKLFFLKLFFIVIRLLNFPDLYIKEYTDKQKIKDNILSVNIYIVSFLH